VSLDLSRRLARSRRSGMTLENEQITRQAYITAALLGRVTP
jgi:hypothetical protein